MPMRTRLVWCALVLGLVAASDARADNRPYYLALGDSLAVGVQPQVDGTLVPTTQGYADDLYAFYRRSWVPGLRLEKLGCSGEKTGSMISGIDSPCTYSEGSQLNEAVAFIQTHRVVLITLDIGGDNLLACLNLGGPVDPTCVGDAATTAANELAIILTALRASASTSLWTQPDVLMVGANYYDPFLAAFVFGSAGQALAVASLEATNFFNSAIEIVYQAMDVPMADVAAAFRIAKFPANVLRALAWTWMSAKPPRGPDIHPNALGYFAIAYAYAKAAAAP